MSRAKARVTFSSSGKNVSWLGDLKDASDDEIAAFTWDCRWALHSLNIECLRRKAKDAKTAPISDLTKTIEENAVKINQVGELIGSQKDNIMRSKSFLCNLAPKISETQHDKHHLEFCKELCWQVTERTSWHLTLLLIASFGRKSLGRLKPDQGIEVLRYLHKNQFSLTDRVRDVLGAKVVAFGLQGGKQCLFYDLFLSDL
ncbi:hypothetical protein IMSHALPRED_001681 [Imshaugia aleurites]|uniref:Uncharacterized protein n=1 Tax=Imshaugia aleurites TaxID=172621 RepID=A0A8H3PGP1_9LECA|nr:hypothetical protein IMSHALPRED_001681 [Imshaugia aleurites]